MPDHKTRTRSRIHRLMTSHSLIDLRELIIHRPLSRPSKRRRENVPSLNP